MTSASALDYSRSSESWENGPARLVYDDLARALVAASPIALGGRRVLDIGAGTGAASRALGEVGARPIALDGAEGMLAWQRAARPPAAVADALVLPFPDASVDAVVAAFCFNHLADPAEGMREAARVLRRGGAVLVSTYAATDTHPVKRAVEAALSECGWSPPPWYGEVRSAMRSWGSVEAATAMAHAGGWPNASVAEHAVPFPDLSPHDLVAWRVGAAQCAPFFTALDHDRREAVVARALDILGPDPEPLVRRVIFVTGLR